MRLDQYLVDTDIAKSRSQAQDLIKRSLILVNEKVENKPSYQVKESDLIKIEKETLFVSRAGEKLLQAVLDFHIDLYGKICLDIGSSTGGFTDCALKQGAKFVYAYDVGKDQLDESLRNHQQIELHEETNILHVDLPDVDFIMIDVSFTSIKPILAHISHHQKEMICLIKPQFEAGHIHFKQGVLKDLNLHKAILTDILEYARSLGLSIAGIKKSVLKGKKGNQEYMLYIKPQKNIEDIKKIIGDLYA